MVSARRRKARTPLDELQGVVVARARPHKDQHMLDVLVHCAVARARDHITFELSYRHSCFSAVAVCVLLLFPCIYEKNFSGKKSITGDAGNQYVSLVSP